MLACKNKSRYWKLWKNAVNDNILSKKFVKPFDKH